MNTATKTERRDFLVEIGTEELPPRALHELELAFAEGIRTRLEQAQLAHGEIRSFASPRRLAVLVKRLAARQPDAEMQRRGPPLNAAKDAQGAWTRAALAFAQSNGVTPDELKRVTEAKGEFLYFVGTRAGAATADLLPDMVRGSLEQLPTPKRMRWGAGEAEFVRPVHWIVMLYGRDVIPVRLLDTDSGAITRGHRFHAPKPIKVNSPATYESTLEKRGRVIADFAKRRERVRAQVTETATSLGGRAVLDAELLDEVTALVEWPVPVAGRFEDRFLALPREVLISTLQEHQRYFPVEDTNGRLLPWFITLSNIESTAPERVREGNERVVRPRLTDAAFFWEQDRKQPLAARRAGLDAVTYQAKLGSVGDKVRRVVQLAGHIAGAMHANVANAERAAELSKCDLLSAMVGEFPDLQGVMGQHYAAADGEPAEIAAAIREHYLPRGAGDDLPATPSGIAVALADKLDTLAGIFAIGQKPSGTKDPFGLRRAAIGVVRILVEKRLELDVAALVDKAASAQPVSPPEGATAVARDVLDYVLERYRGYCLEGDVRGEKVSTEMFDAVLATKPRSLLDFEARMHALVAFLRLPEAASLTAANKRIVNILRKSEGAGSGAGNRVDEAQLREPAERALHEALAAMRDGVARSIASRAYGDALGALARLRPQVDAFFDKVMVNDPDAQLRANRMALLGQLSGLFAGIADLSRLPG